MQLCWGLQKEDTSVLGRRVNFLSWSAHILTFPPFVWAGSQMPPHAGLPAACPINQGSYEAPARGIEKGDRNALVSTSPGHIENKYNPSPATPHTGARDAQYSCASCASGSGRGQTPRQEMDQANVAHHVAGRGAGFRALHSTNNEPTIPVS